MTQVVIHKLNREIDATPADPNFTRRLAGLGNSPMSMMPAELGEFIADQTET